MKILSNEAIKTTKDAAGQKYWNVTRLRKEIRKLTKEANKILQDVGDRDDYKRLAKRLQSLSDSGGKRNKGMFVTNLNYKTSKELSRQLRGLQQFIDYDTLSERAKKEQLKEFFKAKTTYERNTGETLTDEEYNKRVEFFAGVKDLLEEYGSGNLLELTKAAEKQGKSLDLKRNIQIAEMIAERRGILKTPENILDIIYVTNGLR